MGAHNVVRITILKIFASTLLLTCLLTAHATESATSIEIGIAPFLPIQTLVKNYGPLRKYLQHQLHENVTIISAPDYRTFYKRIEQHTYPVIITPANSAYLAWHDSAYVPLLRPLANTQPVVVVAKDQPFSYLSDLRGKTVAMPDALAIVSMQGLQMLRDAGLKTGYDFTLKNMQNHRVAVNFVIAGEADAAIVSDRAIMQMPDSVRAQIKIVYTWKNGAAPGVVYLGSPKLSQDKLKLIKKSILEFAQNTPEGIKLMHELGYVGLESIAEDGLKSLAPYGNMLKTALDENK